MHPPRPFVITAAMFALGECVAAIGGCASKQPEAESAVSASATVQPSSKSPSSSTTRGTPTGGAGSVGSAASGSASADPEAGTGGSPSGVASGNGVSGDRSAGSATAGSAMPPSMDAQTSEERRAVLDKRLDDTLGAFDAKLRSEQQKLAQERDARQTAVTTVAASGGADDANNGGVHGKDGGTDDSSGSNSPGETGNSANRSGANRGHGESRSARAGDLKSDRSTAGANGNASASGNGAVANEIPDGSDDDIVARRLRKAAEQETDPELKDKLWKEYVEYKKNTQGK